MTEENTTITINSMEALVYSEGGEMPTSKLLKALSISAEQLKALVQEYNSTNRGLSMVNDDNLVVLRVSSEYASLVEYYRGESEEEDLSKASLEVLSIVLYKGSVTASELEHIRGVNSGYTLRQLAMRGMLNKSKKGMSYVYAPTAELYSYLGITSAEKLPQHSDVLRQLSEFEKQKNDRKTK